MSPELIFLLTLALRMAITAAFVVSASIITEKSGPVIGALVATLPISAGPSYVFLALDHDAAFIAEGGWGGRAPAARVLFFFPPRAPPGGGFPRGGRAGEPAGQRRNDRSGIDL